MQEADTQFCASASSCMTVGLLNLPNIIGLEQLLEVVILLLGADLSELCVNGIVVGRSIDVANHTEGDGESILRRHHGELQLQGVVLTVSIVDEYVVDGVAVLANLYHLQSEALLYETELVVLTEHEFLAVTYVDGVLLTTFVVVNHIVTVVVEDDTVLQHLGDAGTLVLVGSLQHLDSSLGIGSHTTGEEMATGTEAELGRTEGILDRTVRARLRDETTG